MTTKLLRHFCSHPVRLYRNVRFWSTRRQSAANHVFIWGCPRSGTTLLKSLLVAHPAIAGTDQESTGLFNFRDVFDYRIGELKPAEIDALLSQSNDLIDFYDAVAQEYVNRKGASHFVDKIQPRRYRLEYVLRHFSHARFLNIVRDGRDCYCSARKHPHVVQARSLRGFAKYWAETTAIPETMVPATRMYTVRYEALAATPEPVLEDLMQFIDQPYLASQTDVASYSRTTIRKREVHKNLSKPINSQSVERWRQDLSESENTEFCSIAGETLQRLGYAVN